MKIGVISDTHIPSAGPEPPEEVIRAFAGVDLILHAGHANVASCLEWLARIAPVKATESWLVGTGEGLTRDGRLEVFELEGYVVAMVHELILTSLGDDVLPGSIARSFPRDESFSETIEATFGRRIDVVVCGYTHEAMVEEHDGVLIVNPGSPSLVRQQVRLGTVAILELSAAVREARIVNLADV
ncbi:MAG: metallophosphoesterase family protein [Dehalococcoidia bacterium]